MRASWAVLLALLTVGLACRATPPPVAPSHDAQILAASSPGTPLAPSSPEPAQRQLAPFVVEILGALVLASAGSSIDVVAERDDAGPRSAHARRIDRPPIPPRVSS